MSDLKIEVCKGRAGLALYINDERVAGVRHNGVMETVLSATFAHPCAGQPAAVAVALRQCKSIAEAMNNQNGETIGANRIINIVDLTLASLSPSSIDLGNTGLLTHVQKENDDLGGEVERLTRELHGYQARVIPAETEVVRLEAALHDLQTRFDLELDGYAKDSDMAALRARLATAENALQPFAKLAEAMTESRKPDDWTAWGYNDAGISYGDFRRARAALSGGSRDG